MARPVSSAQVEVIRPLGRLVSYDPFIAGANPIVDQLPTLCGQSFTDELLEQIEIWLSAHLAEMTDSSDVRRKEFEGASTTWNVAQLGSGINGSTFGQMANTLSGGCLGRLDKTRALVQFA